MIGEVRYTADYGVQLRLIELARFLEGLEPAMRFGRKILAKLGIACVDSYRGAEAIDVLGLDDEIAEMCFVSTRPVLGGVGLVNAVPLESSSPGVALPKLP